MNFWEQAVVALTDPLVLGGVALLVALRMAASFSARAGARFLASFLLAWAAAHLLKFLVRDPRPAGAAIDAWGSGWPSGHSAVGAAAALSLWFVLSPRVSSRPYRCALAAALVAGALALAASRLYLGVHDLGDVLGGLAVGAFAAFLLRPPR